VALVPHIQASASMAVSQLASTAHGVHPVLRRGPALVATFAHAI